MNGRPSLFQRLTRVGIRVCGCQVVRVSGGTGSPPPPERLRQSLQQPPHPSRCGRAGEEPGIIPLGGEKFGEHAAKGLGVEFGEPRPGFLQGVPDPRGFERQPVVRDPEGGQAPPQSIHVLRVDEERARRGVDFSPCDGGIAFDGGEERQIVRERRRTGADAGCLCCQRFLGCGMRFRNLTSGGERSLRKSGS